MRVGLALFTLNEEKTIESLLSLIDEQGIEFSHKVLIDDSKDSTAEIAKKWGYTIAPGGGSLGRAFMQAMEYFRHAEIDYLITMDGDGQARPSEITYFLQNAERSGADLVLGSRFLDTGLINYNYPLANRLGVILLSTYLRLETGQKITDSHGGVRCYSKRFIKECSIRGTHTYIQESILHARDYKLKILELPSAWNSRAVGESRVVRSKIKYALKVAPILALRSKRCVPLFGFCMAALMGLVFLKL